MTIYKIKKKIKKKLNSKLLILLRFYFFNCLSLIFGKFFAYLYDNLKKDLNEGNFNFNRQILRF